MLTHEQHLVRNAVFDRDGFCLLSPLRDLNPWGTAWGPCFGLPLTPHHLRKNSQGGPYTEENLVTLCSGHNDMVEDYPNAAHAIGLVLWAGETQEDLQKLACYRMMVEEQGRGHGRRVD